MTSGAQAVDLPREFTGKWQDTLSSDSGTLSISISENINGVLRGTISIGGSSYCKTPVVFVGTHVDDVVRVTSDEFFPCGYAGTLTGIVWREGESVYLGSFSYTLFKVWAHGTFRLSPAPLNEPENISAKE